VLVNLDQCGHSDVRLHTIQDILVSFSAAEIFCTFAIKSLMASCAKAIQCCADIEDADAIGADRKPVSITARQKLRGICGNPRARDLYLAWLQYRQQISRSA
jgi:hypothetical protein